MIAWRNSRRSAHALSSQDEPEDAEFPILEAKTEEEQEKEGSTCF